MTRRYKFDIDRLAYTATTGHHDLTVSDVECANSVPLVPVLECLVLLLEVIEAVVRPENRR